MSNLPVVVIKLADLHLASEAPDELGLHVRKAKDSPLDFAGLKASLAAVGLLVPLLVTLHEETFYVIGGNRRLAALRELHGDDDVPVNCIRVEGANGAAAEIAVMSNIALPMHPIDQFEVVAGAKAAGMTDEDIGARWGMTQRRVAQVVAFGALSPKVRQAWRDGLINGKAAAAFTLTDHAHQDKLLAAGLKHGLSENQITYSIVGQNNDVGSHLMFVGIPLYRAAGGTVDEDLFGTSHRVSDRKLLTKLYNERLDACAAALVADGWKWAVVPPPNSYAYGKVEPKKTRKPTPEQKVELDAIVWRADDGEDGDALESGWVTRERIEGDIRLASYGPEERAGLGCFIKVSRGGKLMVDPGRAAPQEKKSAEAKERASERKKKAAKVEAKGEPAQVISNALMQRMSEWLTEAASQAIMRSPLNVALAAIIAGALSHDKTVAIQTQGLVHSREDRKLTTFLGAFEEHVGLPNRSLTAAIIGVASRALDFQVFRGDQRPLDNKGVRALCELLNPKEMSLALLGAFDAEDYFNSVAKPVIVAAMQEIGASEDALKALAKAPKAEAVQIAVEHAKKAKWLPLELRTVHYAGPGAKAAAAKKGKRK